MSETATPGLASGGERRLAPRTGYVPGAERRQFASNYEKLSPAARELAFAIDHYKLDHHRRFIDHEEMLQVILSLGYRKTAVTDTPVS